MIEREHVVAAILEAAGGRLIGRVRFQKTAYFLDLFGLGSPFRYEYHHYGPYSRDLDNAILDAQAFDYAKEERHHRQTDGAAYSVFKTGKKPAPAGVLGDLDPGKASELVQRFAGTNLTVLELAATVDWLWRHEHISHWRDEITRRKGVKVGNGRLDQAAELLRSIGLPPPDSEPAPKG